MNKPFSRRRALMATATLSLGLCSAWTQAQTYPSQNIKFVVPYAAGGATDALARMVGQKLQEAWGQTVVIENRPGAGGTIGNNLVAKAPADGYTLLYVNSSFVTVQAAQKRFDLLRQFTELRQYAIHHALLDVFQTDALHEVHGAFQIPTLFAIQLQKRRRIFHHLIGIMIVQIEENVQQILLHKGGEGRGEYSYKFCSPHI